MAFTSKVITEILSLPEASLPFDPHALAAGGADAALKCARFSGGPGHGQLRTLKVNLGAHAHPATYKIGVIGWLGLLCSLARHEPDILDKAKRVFDEASKPFVDDAGNVVFEAEY